MKTLEDYEERIDNQNRAGLMKCKLYNYLKEKVGNLIGRKYEHESFLIDEIADDLNDGDYDKNDDIRYEEKRILLDKLNHGEDKGIDVVECAYLLDFLVNVGI